MFSHVALNNKLPQVIIKYTQRLNICKSAKTAIFRFSSVSNSSSDELHVYPQIRCN